MLCNAWKIFFEKVHKVRTSASGAFLIKVRLGRLGLGLLMPKKKNDKASDVLWAKNFTNAYKAADQERTTMGWLLHYGLKWFLGLVYPTNFSARDGLAHGFSFEMKNPLSFYMDVLYLDEDIRITKGSRGTIVVVDRLSKTYIVG